MLTPINGVHVRVIEPRPGCFMPQFTTDNLTWRNLEFHTIQNEQTAKNEADRFARLANAIPEQGRVLA